MALKYLPEYLPLACRYLFFFLLALSNEFLFSCQSNKKIGLSPSFSASSDTLNNQAILAASPVVSPSESLRKMQVETGFAVKLVAAEPLISTPIALTFDNKARLWVIEMDGYMPDTLGTGEDTPNGKVVILTDKNKDGLMDQRQVVLDSLVLPRALCLLEGGLLVATPPSLWYYEIKNDRPVRKVLVDGKYTEGGNVEHQPNGLMRALDNWIYSANSEKRYRKQGEQWLVEKTHNRGQWGITQDNWGRLYYNNNSQNLLGDYFAPSLGATNVNQRRVAGYNEKIVPDNKVFPARPTPGVNRGYMENILDNQLRLREFTAACGPVIYRGDLFGNDYAGNAFVAEPAGNLIKRNVLSDNGYQVQGEQAYRGKEFLTSVDERFRPVSLYNGPDGAMYVVDMYRGIIQHKTYLTNYLKKEIQSRALSQPLSYGRIYKVVPAQKAGKIVKLPHKPEKLVLLLQHPNGWVRDKAHQMLVDGHYTQVVPKLRGYLKKTDNSLALIHALWTLEGLGALETPDVLALLKQPQWPIRMQALSVSPNLINQSSYQQFAAAFMKLIDQRDSLAAPYIGFLAQSIQTYNPQKANDLLQALVKTYPNNIYVADAAISNLQEQENNFLKDIIALNPDNNLAVAKQLQRVITAVNNKQNSRNPMSLEGEFPKGAALFKSTCQTCHGPEGNGIKSLAPPLNKSEWVTGDKNKLISIVLFGLTGPVPVAGTLYKAPEITGDMPGIGYNKDLPNEEIAQLLSFIRQSWNNNAERVSTQEVTLIRQQLANRQKAFTVEELEKK